LIDFPSSFVVESIHDCCFIRFKDVKHAPTAPHHYYFVIPSNEMSEVLYIISIVTSRFENRLYFYQKTPNPKATESLVRLEKGSFGFVTKESAINCNAAEKLTKTDLLRRIDKNVGMKIEEPNIEIDLKEKIISAIMNSPLVAPALKSTLKTIS